MGYLDQILHSYLFSYCQATGMQNGGEGLLSIILAAWGLLVKILITLKSHGVFNQILPTNTFLHYRDTGMQNGD